MLTCSSCCLSKPLLYSKGSGSGLSTQVKHVSHQLIIEPELLEIGACQTGSGTTYYSGMRWVQTQGSQQMLCTCVSGGISCEEWGTAK